MSFVKPLAAYLALLALAAFARPGKTAAIDEFCLSLRREFAEATPAYFTGPDPWSKLEHLPDACQPPNVAPETCSRDGVVVATIYYEGQSVKWLILQMQAPGDGWFETTNYFFNSAGFIQKRERHLDQHAAHIQVQEDLYFVGQKVIRTNYHDSLLSDDTSLKQVEDWNLFYDPQAPFYTDAADLPAAFLQIDLRYLAGDRDFLSSHALSSLLKFTQLDLLPAQRATGITMLNFETLQCAETGWHRR